MTEKNDQETHNDNEPDYHGRDQELDSALGYYINDMLMESPRELCPDSDQEGDEPTAQEDEETKAAFVEMKKKKKKKALMEFRCRVEDAIVGNYLLGKPSRKLCRDESLRQKEQLKEITLWGVPLLPSKGHKGTDAVLLKFLRARDFKTTDAFEMLRRTLKWRKEYRADEILEEELGGPDLDNVVCIKSRDKEGHPLCYTVYGPFKDRELYNKTFGSEAKRQQFLRWRIQFIEKGIKKLNFKRGVDSMVQITDLKNSPGPDFKELRSLSSKTLLLLQENYPELIQKNIVINAPLWYYVLHVLRSRFLSHRTKKKFVFARPQKVTKTLLKFIEPEELPVQYGGLKREQDEDFTPEDKVSQIIVKGNTTNYIKIPVAEGGLTMVWDLTVVGWDVLYKEEFVPDDEGSYKILLQDKKRLQGEGVRNSFYLSEPGKIVIALENWNFKNRRVLYRYKAKPTIPIYLTNR
ncbi:patellin-4-like [Rosa rugosa]|uniref:patellin-4-like n=1 Tax=Rosa rugosa TaxID=74645 RepID=UPI002B411D9A|nr:patellin-4-like [Rosa rugosa]